MAKYKQLGTAKRNCGKKFVERNWGMYIRIGLQNLHADAN